MALLPTITYNINREPQLIVYQHISSAHWTRALRWEPSVHTASVESVLARQRRPLLALAEILAADGAFSFVLQNFALGVLDLARWEPQKLSASFVVFPISRILLAVASVTAAGAAVSGALASCQRSGGRWWPAAPTSMWEVEAAAGGVRMA